MMILAGLTILAACPGALSFIIPTRAPSSASPLSIRCNSKILTGRASAIRLFNKRKTLAEEIDDLKLDESTLSENEKKNLQKFRDAYKLDEVLDFKSKDGKMLPRKEDPDYDPLDDAEDLAIEKTAWSGQAGLDVATKGDSSWSDVSKRPILAFGDALVVLIFTAIGRTFHGGSLNPIAPETLAGAAPFLTAWLLLAPLLGAYTPNATRSSGDAAVSLLKAWVIAVPAGIALRGLVKGEVPPTPFIGVAMAMTLVFLGAWRGLYVSLSGDEVKGSGGNKKGGVFDVFRMITTLINRW